MRAVLTAIAMLAWATGAHGEVTGSWDTGFSIENRTTTQASPEVTWTALGQVGRWWSSDHSYSGDAANMTLEMKPGGCWCEAVPGGGVEHGRVIMIMPEARTLRLSAALGPLQPTAVTGILTWTVKPTDTGGSEIVQTYRVSGGAPGTDAMSAPVDAVLAEQLGSLRSYVEPPVP